MHSTKRNATIADIDLVYGLLQKTYGASGWWPSLYGGDFEIICGAILTQNVAWRNVKTALTKMRESGLWSWQALLDASDAELGEAIRASGYYKTKAKKLKIFAKVVVDEYAGDLSRLFALDLSALRQKLLGIWGIGPETADDIVLYAAEKPTFVIDRYTMRLVDRLGWRVDGNDYHDYKAFFENLLFDATPKSEIVEKFKEFHGLIDIHSARICKKTPICGNCCLASVCDYAKLQG